jgi:erythromycin esterase
MKRHIKALRRLLAPAIAVLAVTAALSPGGRAEAGTSPELDRWLVRHAAPLASVHPAAPLDDLAPLARSLAGTQIVGLGESVHGSAEETLLKHRVVRFLVERLGFRSIAWEDDWTTGMKIDRYIRTGQGDLTALARQMGGQWQSREVTDVLQWLRQFNRGRVDKVRFVGVEYYLTGRSAYDFVDDYVRSVAPADLSDIRAHLQPLRPTVPDIYSYIALYQQVPDKRPYLEHARALYDLVSDLPHAESDPDHALVLRTVRQIVSFYEHFSLPEADALVYRDARAAENVKWWREYTGNRIAYWAATPHTANAADMRIVTPPDGQLRFRSAGSYLRCWYGNAYTSVAFTFNQGEVSLGDGRTAVMPPALPSWFEQPLARVHFEQFVVDLPRHGPPAVRRWLEAPIRTRALAGGGSGSYISGSSAAEWFDVVVHRQVVTPVNAL